MIGWVEFTDAASGERVRIHAAVIEAVRPARGAKYGSVIDVPMLRCESIYVTELPDEVWDVVNKAMKEELDNTEAIPLTEERIKEIVDYAVGHKRGQDE